MLDALRAATKTRLGRIIMSLVVGLLILAFGYWGIADIFRGFGADELARVGSDTISVTAYREAYQAELQLLQQRARRAITNDEARRMGVDREVLTRLISEAMLAQAARRFDLAISDHDLAAEIVQDPMFKGPDGKFDRQLFEGRLQQNRLTEQGFVFEQRRAYLRRQIVAAMSQGLALPQSMVDAIHRFYNETRSIDYLQLPKSSVGAIKPPSDADLTGYYEAHLQAYRTREYRKLVVLIINLDGLADALAKKAPISDADVEKHYEDVKATRFTEPEKRHVEQILFADQASAEAAAKKLAAGATYESLIAERKLAPNDVDLGTVAKDAIVDPAIAAAAFALAEGQVSQPVKGTFGYVLLRVDKIIPSQITPFEKVAATLRQEMGLARAHREISTIHDLVEKQRDDGKSLAEAAKAAGLITRGIDAIDAQGNDKSGKPVPEVPDMQALLKAVFASDIGIDNEPISTRDGGVMWFEVAGIEPARQQTLDEVKPAVTASWSDDARAEELAAKADAMVKKLTGGATLASLATENKLSLQHKDGIKRAGAAGLSPGVVAQIFGRKVGSFGAASDASGDEIIFKVADAKVPPIDAKEADFVKLLAEVKTAFGNDIADQYLAQLQHQLGVRLNQQALRAAIGSE
jgi:peptidyl-prolyl cis-trans isomerase D